MSKANRHAQSKDLLSACGAPGLMRHFRHEPTGVAALGQAWRLTYPIGARPGGNGGGCPCGAVPMEGTATGGAG
jgi:hypothetical protein